MTSVPMQEFFDGLRKYPLALVAAFEASQPDMLFDDESQSLRWSQEGLRVAQRAPRAWEAASEYFRASPEVAKLLSFPELLRWVEIGSSLCEDSPTIASAFFRASPIMLINLPVRNLQGWASLGRSLGKATWKSSRLAARYFEISPDLMRYLNFRELGEFTELVDDLSARSYDLASECLHLGQRVLPIVKEKSELISLARTLVPGSWREVRACFETASKVNDSISSSQRSSFIILTKRLAIKGMSNISGFILESTSALGMIPLENHEQVLIKAGSLADYTPEAVGAFIKSVPHVLERISPAQFDLWFGYGVELLTENPDSGVAYFRLESSRAEKMLEDLSATVELDRVSGLLSLYSRALVGPGVQLLPVDELAGKNIGWVSTERSTTDGTHIYLPPIVDGFGQKQENFAWLKVVTTHQLGHLEFESFGFQMDRNSKMFDDLRPKLFPKVLADDNGFSTDMSEFFNFFPLRQLAGDIFSTVEDARIDSLMVSQYRGLKQRYRWVQEDALSKRPPIEGMPLQQAMVELILRLGLEPNQIVSVPVQYQTEAHEIAGLLAALRNPDASVEDSAEVTIRIYRIISSLLNEEIPEEQWQEQEFGDEEIGEEDVQQMVNDLLGESMVTQEGHQGYEGPEEVEYRGEFKPEMVQLLSRIRSMDTSEEVEDGDLTQDELEEMLKASLELELGEADEAQSYASNLLKEKGVNLPPPQQGSGHQDISHQEDGTGPLEVREPRSFVYDEWDFRANDYRPRWCVVQEKYVLTGEPNFFSDTLQAHSGLMNQIRHQFEAIRPETYRKVRHLSEGEDVDLDSAIDALIDLRSGVTPNDDVYWRRNKIERDVGVVFLLDMSASTAEAVEEIRRNPEWDMPNDPTAYAAWLRARRTEGGRRQYKRIIDVEKESMVLLMTALEIIGDRYGVYGFSGFGRENVEFYVIKDIDEQLSERVKSRLDKVAPLHATRMGPAIRHATMKLDRVAAKTKFLFVISDGRPQDRGYSREGVEKEYAVEDTHMALIEAKLKDITPFCLTVDRQGHDYLRTMAGDMGYEVLPDIMELPRRLPYLYRRLTL